MKREYLFKQKNLSLALIFLVSLITSASGISSISVDGESQSSCVNVLDYGVVNDGETLNTDAINSLIERISKKGGGKIVFPEGDYLTGTINLASNIALFLGPGATIVGSEKFEDYPLVESRYQGETCVSHSALIRGERVENVSISGNGTIDGRGKVWWDRAFQFKFSEDPVSLMNENEKELWKLNKSQKQFYHLRPCLIEFYWSKHIKMEGITLKNSAFWTVHPTYSEDINISNLTITNPKNSKNTDGIDPDSCRDVRITGCLISTGDDGIAIKSGKDEDGQNIGIPSEDITISDCTILDGHGGVVIGSEMSGSVRNVVVNNCVFKGTKRGIRFKSRRGRGGIVEDIHFNNIEMQGIVEGCIIIDMLYYDNSVGGGVMGSDTPTIQKINISNVRGNRNGQVFQIHGLVENKIKDLRLSKIELKSTDLGEIFDVSGITISDSIIEANSDKPMKFIRVEDLVLRGNLISYSGELLEIVECEEKFN